MPRLHLFALATSLSSALIGTAAHGQAPNGDYVRQMPTPEQVETAVKGSSALDTAARQLGVLWQLQDLIDALAGKQHRQLTMGEKSLSAAYLKAFVGIREPIDRSLPDADQRRFYSLHVRYQQDKGLRDEALARTVPEAARRAIYAGLGEPMPSFPGIQPLSNSAATSQPHDPGAARTLVDRGTQQLKADATGAAAAERLVRAGQAYAATAKQYEANNNDAKAKELRLKAVDCYTRAIQADRTLTNAYYLLGDLYVDLGHPAMALPVFQRIVQMKPNDVNAVVLVGDTQYRLDQYADAIKTLTPAVKLKASSVALSLANTDLGCCYYKSKRYAEAVPPLRESLRLDPKAASVWDDLGQTYFKLDRFELSLAAYEEAVRLEPDNAQYHFDAGVLYAVMGRKSDADRVYKLLQTLDKARAKEFLDLTTDQGKQ